MKCIRFIFIVLLSVTQEAYLILNVRKYVNHKDMSEYCKRRVIPSMFLGKEIKDDNLNIIYFSQLDLPYSCMLSVRTESGNNIILVIRMITESGLKEACSRNNNQMIVYQLGETFGGYWGPLSDEILNPASSNATTYYTVQTTLPSTSVTAPSTTASEESNIFKLDATFQTETAKEEDEYITVEVPLVNISGNLQLQKPSLQVADEMFDAIYDVTPQKNVEYRTTLMPLVKFSIHRQTKGENNTSDQIQLYDIDYEANDSGFTLDSRLLFSTAHKRKLTKKNYWMANRRIHFTDKSVKKSTTMNYFYRLFTTQRASFGENTPSHTVKSFHEEHTTAVVNRPDVTTDSWHFIDDIINSYNLTTTTVRENITRAILLDRISNIKNPNISAYLFSNLSLYDGHVGSEDFQTSTKNYLEYNITTSELSSLDIIKTDSSNIKYTKPVNNTDAKEYNSTIEIATRDTLKKELEKQDSNADTLGTFIEDQENNSLKSTQEIITDNATSSTDRNLKGFQNLSTAYTIHKAPITGSLVDRESWENIVQVAPMLATVLNKTDALHKSQIGDVPESLMPNIISGNNRTRRYMKSLEFEKSEPRNLTQETSNYSDVTERTYSISDIQRLAQLVEVQDDELERMMLVVTPAIALLNNRAQCPLNHLECQILGTRVCVDSTKACDGVPNCGSDNIYDEDRIRCGITVSSQYVAFAAFAFLVVIFTVIYIVHHWLMRCVPKVSKAFFIYTDESENILHLQTVMRAPFGDNNVEDSQKFPNVPSQFSENDLVCHDIAVKEQEGSWKMLLRKCFYRILCYKRASCNDEKQREKGQDLELIEAELKKKIPQKDEITQTGRSIEMKIIKNNNAVEREPFNVISEKHVNELGLIKLINEKRSLLQSDSDLKKKKVKDKKEKKEKKVKKLTNPNEERELQSTVYEHRHDFSVASRIEPKETMHLKKDDEESIEKHLRFIEQPTLIPELKINQDQLLQNPSNINYQPSSSGLNLNPSNDIIKQKRKDSRNYWSIHKGKKSKKVAKMSLR